jgi:hypothetical protein
VEFSEWLCTEVLKYMPHRHWVFSIPKRLRIYFMMDRRLLSKLSQCAWKVLSRCLKQTVPYEDAVAGAVIFEGKINDVVIENMINWRHSGFNVYCSKAIWPHNEAGLENLARYIIRASFSQERLTYIAADESANGVAKVIYESKGGKTSKTFDALDWLAQLTAHIPNRGEFRRRRDQILWILLK